MHSIDSETPSSASSEAIGEKCNPDLEYFRCHNDGAGREANVIQARCAFFSLSKDKNKKICLFCQRFVRSIKMLSVQDACQVDSNACSRFVSVIRSYSAIDYKVHIISFELYHAKKTHLG